MRVTVSSLALLLAAALLPSATAFHVPSNPRQQQQTRMMAGGGYQEQLARARAEKAARQAAAASGQPYQPPPPMARPPPPPAPAPMPPQQQAYQQQQPPPPVAAYQQPPQAAAGLSGGTQDAVATLLAVLGERLASGRPLSPQRVQAFSHAAEALVAEARAAQQVAQYATPPQQQRPPQQQHYSQPQQQPQQPQPTTQPNGGMGFKAAGFEQDEEIPWQLGSRTLSGPQPGYRAASAFQAKSGFDEDGDDFSQGLPQPVTRGATTGTRSPFMQTLKGTPFYVDVDQQQVSPEEYRAIIGKRISEAQMARRRSGQAFGNEVSNSYMDDLNKRKQEMIRQRAQQQSQQWQQQVDQQQQGGGGAGGYYPQQ